MLPAMAFFMAATVASHTCTFGFLLIAIIQLKSATQQLMPPAMLAGTQKSLLNKKLSRFNLNFF